MSDPHVIDPANPRPCKKKGFGSLSKEDHKKIASKGGVEAHKKGTAHEFTREEAQIAGRKGGFKVSQDKSHMAMIGRKGGQSKDLNRRITMVNMPRNSSINTDECRED